MAMAAWASWIPSDYYRNTPSLVLILVILGPFIVKADEDTSVFESVHVAEYKGYSTVWIVPYSIPELTTSAKWTFLVEVNNPSCPTLPISIYLQPGGYPVINPANETFPNNFHVNGSDLRNITIPSNQTEPYLQAETNPVSGAWYAIILRGGHDKVVQKITDMSCDYGVSSNLTVNFLPSVEDLIIGPTKITINLALKQPHVYYRFFLSERLWKYTIQITNCMLNNTKCLPCPLSILTRSQALPTNKTDSHHVNCSEKTGDLCEMSVIGPGVNQYEYMQLSKLNDLPMTFNLTIITEVCGLQPQIPSSHSSQSSNHLGVTFMKQSSVTSQPTYPCVLIRRMYRIAEVGNDFRVTYAVNATRLEYVENVAKVTDQFGRVFQFDVVPLVDSGGTLRFHATFNNSLKITSKSFVNLTICMKRNSIPTLGSHVYCEAENRMNLSSASNDTSSVTRFIPYPRSGSWYIVMQSQCYRVINGSAMPVVCAYGGVSVKFDLGITPCLDGGCSNGGTCRQYIRGILVYSACSCVAKYRGYACTDASDVQPRGKQILYTLLLSMSNLFFIPACGVAIYKKYYAEAVVYFANMFFSMFYHACDMSMWSTYDWCMMPYHVLSYSDFFCSILSFWVTLIAMAQLNHTLTSVAHIVGALLLSMGVEWQKSGFITYIVPITFGLFTVIVSWAVRCRKRKRCYPNRREWLMIIPGFILAITGICIFALIETDSNYPYTHSFWHFCMALSIIFFLPKKQKHPFNSESVDSSHTSLIDDSGPVETVGLMPADEVCMVNAAANISNDKDDVVLLD